MSDTKFSPLLSLALHAQRRRMEMQCDPQWVLDVFAKRDALRAEVEALRGELQEERSAAESLRFSAWRHGDFLSVRDLLGMFCPDGVAGVDQAGMEHVARKAADEVVQLRQQAARYEHQRRLNQGDIPTT